MYFYFEHLNKIKIYMQKQQLEDRYWKKVKIPMLSQAGKAVEKQLMIDIMFHSKLYNKKVSQNIQTYQKVVRKTPRKSTSAFCSPGRSNSKDSYLLRFQKQLNLKSNYEPKYDKVLQLMPKYTITNSKFQRRINIDTERLDKNLHKKGEPKSSRCQKSNEKFQAKALVTARDLSDWRKQHHEMDFTKQLLYTKKDDEMRSTGYKTMKSLRVSTQQNKSKISENKNKYMHDFSSYLPHNYLELKEDDRLPITDLLKANFDQVKPFWDPHKSHVKFNMFRDQIRTKQDRSEQIWNNVLDYNPEFGLTRKKLYRKVQLNKTIPRQQNLVNSKYPHRLSQRNDYNLRKQVILKNELNDHLNKNVAL